MGVSQGFGGRQGGRGAKGSGKVCGLTAGR